MKVLKNRGRWNHVEWLTLGAHEKYKNVCVYQHKDDPSKMNYLANVRRKVGFKQKNYFKNFETAKEAALAVDMWLIDNNFPPVNILKPKITE
jgi:hypothetical protein